MTTLKKGKLTASDLRSGRNGIILTPKKNLKPTMIKKSEFNTPIDPKTSERKEFEREVSSVMDGLGLSSWGGAMISLIDTYKDGQNGR